MEYVQLGKTDIKVSRITHGCMELGGGFLGLNWQTEEKEHNIRLLEMALEQGINMLDTAEVYGNGNSEKIVGEALSGRRKKCIIATKVSPENLGKRDVRIAVENSLRRLSTDYIDLLYIHWPNAEVPLSETLEAFEKLKRDGIIRAIGVSNFSIKQLKEAAELTEVDALQIEYNLLERKDKEELLNLCEEQNISVFSYNSVAKGILTGAFHFGSRVLEENDFRKKKLLFSERNLEAERPLLMLLKEIGEEYPATISQVALAWLLHDKRIGSAIVGTQNEKHFLDNINAVRLKLPETRITQLSEISELVIQNLK